MNQQNSSDVSSPNPYVSPQTVAPAPDSQAVSQQLWEIKKQASNAMVCGVIGFLIGFLGPVAIHCGRHAIRLIDERKMGEEYRDKASTGIMLGKIATGLWIAMLVLPILSVLGILLFT